MLDLLFSLGSHLDFIPDVIAQGGGLPPPGGPCVGFDDIGECGSTGNPLPNFVYWIAFVLVEIASGLAVVFVVIGGAFLVLNGGNEAMSGKGKKAILFALVGYAVALSAQAIVSFTADRVGIIDQDNPHLGIMEVTVASILFIMNAVFAIMMLYYGFKLLFSRGQQSELDSAKKGVTWTIIGAMAINLSYALVRSTEALGF